MKKSSKDKLFEEQTKMVKWTRWLVIATVILASFSLISSLSAVYMAYIQTPQPQLLLNIREDLGILCSGNETNDTVPYGRLLKIANVGTRTAFDVKLIASYEEENSFFDAYFLDYNRSVSRLNPNTFQGWNYAKEATVIGYPYWVVDPYKTTIYLDEIEPGENINLVVRFSGTCGSSKTISFEAREEGYFISSGIKKSTIVWMKR